MPDFEEGIDPETQPQPKRRAKGAAKPAGEKRQRRTSSQAKLALALVETHLAGVYSQMELLTKAIKELRESLS